MLGKFLKKIQAKIPQGKKLYQALGILSGIIWIVSLSLIFLFRDKPQSTEVVEKSESHSFSKPEHDHGEESEHASTPADAKTDESHSSHASSSHDGHEAKSQPVPSPESHVTRSEMPSQEEWQALKEVAELHVAAGNLEKAIPALRRIMVVPTEDVDLLAMATTVFLSSANYREAIHYARLALVLKPKDIPLTIQAIEADFRLGKLESAFEEMETALSKDPLNIALLVQSATMEVEMGPGFENYGKSLLIALKEKPDFAPALYLKGRKAQLEGDYEVAEKVFLKLLAQEPKYPKAHGQLGMVYYHLGKRPEAQKQFELELAQNPKDFNTWFNLGELQLLIASEEVNPMNIQAFRAEAMQSFLMTLEWNPQHAQAHYRVGVLLNGNGEYKEAIKHFEKCLKLDSRHVPTLVQLALAYEYLKRPERAKEYLTRAYEIDPLNKIVLSKLREFS